MFTALGENPLLAPSTYSDDSVSLTTEKRQEKRFSFPLLSPIETQKPHKERDFSPQVSKQRYHRHCLTSSIHCPWSHRHSPPSPQWEQETFIPELNE